MREPGLKDYYEQELRYLRELGAEFATQHEEIASALRLDDTHSDDPHVERLLEGFAFLAARVHRRIDDDFGQICQALLNVVYPHYLRPIPSMAIVQLDPDRGAPPAGFTVPAGSTLVAPPADGVRCRFRTCYDVGVWPLEVSDAGWRTPSAANLGAAARDVAGALSVTLETTGDQTFGELEIDRLQLFLDGDAALVSMLYEHLDNDCVGVLVREPGPPGESVSIPTGALRPMGFAEDEGALPHPGRTFVGYRLLLEYFAFPQKYSFFELSGLDVLRRFDEADSLELVFLIRPSAGPDRQEVLERSVTRETVRLGCTPVVNLFTAESEPIRLKHRRPEYLLRARGPSEHPYQVFSVDEIWAVVPNPARRIPFAPFFSYRHRGAGSEASLFWYDRRRPSSWLESGATDVSVAFVDPSGELEYPDYPSVMAQLTVFNGELPNKLAIGRDRGDLDLEGGGAPLERIRVLTHPTRPLQPPLDASLLWRLVSQLSLNYLSLADDEGDALRELLRLYNFGGFDVGEKHIAGIVSVASEPSYARVRGEHGLTFARGRKVIVEFDEGQFSGGGIYLLASVLERFLAMYASMNSFSALEARVRAPGKTYTLRSWKPRAGSRTLI